MDAANFHGGHYAGATRHDKPFALPQWRAAGWSSFLPPASVDEVEKLHLLKTAKNLPRQLIPFIGGCSHIPEAQEPHLPRDCTGKIRSKTGRELIQTPAAMKLTRLFISAGFCFAIQAACAADARTVVSLNGQWDIAEGRMDQP